MVIFFEVFNTLRRLLLLLCEKIKRFDQKESLEPESNQLILSYKNLEIKKYLYLKFIMTLPAEKGGAYVRFSTSSMILFSSFLLLKKKLSKNLRESNCVH